MFITPSISLSWFELAPEQQQEERPVEGLLDAIA
jgi:hypothetical protein